MPAVSCPSPASPTWWGSPQQITLPFAFLPPALILHLCAPLTWSFFMLSCVYVWCTSFSKGAHQIRALLFPKKLPCVLYVSSFRPDADEDIYIWSPQSFGQEDEVCCVLLLLSLCVHLFISIVLLHLLYLHALYKHMWASSLFRGTPGVRPHVMAGLGLASLERIHHMSFSFSTSPASLAYLFAFCICVFDAPAISLCHIWDMFCPLKCPPLHMYTPTALSTAQSTP